MQFEVSGVDILARFNNRGRTTYILRVVSKDLKRIRLDLRLPPSLYELNHHITVLET